MDGGVEEEPPTPAVFLPRLDDGKGPALPLAASAGANLVNAALLASGFSAEALASLSAETRPRRNVERASGEFPRGAERDSCAAERGRRGLEGEDAVERNEAGAVRPRATSRTSARPLLGTAGRGAIILAILGSSTAAAALTLEWPRVKAAWTRVWAANPEESAASSDRAPARSKALSRRLARPSRSGTSQR
jgi:hypothetical protein